MTQTYTKDEKERKDNSEKLRLEKTAQSSISIFKNQNKLFNLLINYLNLQLFFDSY